MPGAFQVLYELPGPPRVLLGVNWLLTGPDPDLPKILTEQSGEVGSQKPFEQNGVKGLEATFKDEDGEMIVRLYPGKDRVFGARYITSADAPSDPARMQAFFDGFKPNLERAPADDPPAAIKWKEFRAKDGSWTATLPAQFGQDEWSESGCYLPGRIFSVTVDPKFKGDLKTLKARFAKQKEGLISARDATSRGAYKGLEFVHNRHPLAEKDSPMATATLTYVLVLVRPGRAYLVTVAGLKGDSTLEADARRVFDSFQPEPKK